MHGAHLSQNIVHGWIRERVPLLQQVDVQHRRQMRMEAGLTSCSAWASWVRSRRSTPPLHGYLHFREELLAFSLVLSGDELDFREAEFSCVKHSFHGEVPGPVWPDEDSHLP